MNNIRGTNHHGWADLCQLVSFKTRSSKGLILSDDESYILSLSQYIFILKFMAHVWHGYIFSELSSHFIVDTEQRYQINIQTLRIVLYFLVMFFILESPSSQSLLFASSCHPVQGLFSSQIIASCLGFVLDCVLTIYEMQNWGRRGESEDDK